MGGKKKLTPETLHEHFQQYVKETKAKPIMVHDFVGKDGHAAYRQKERPLTFEGFYNYMYLKGVKYIWDYLSNYKGIYDEFKEISMLIKNTIREDQICGGLVGIYHHGITSRLNGLVEKTENKHEVSEIKIIKE